MNATHLQLPVLVWKHPGNRGHRVRALARLAGWQVWERLTRRSWTVVLASVRRLRCEPHSTSASGVIYFGLPDWEEMNLLLDFLRPGDVFIDVGANVGVYSLLASVVPDVETWAFEPSSDTAGEARANVTLNGMDDRIHVVQAAVGAEPGEALLSVGLGTVNRLVADSNGGAAETVPVVTVDGLVPESDRMRVRMMKIDVEGTELDVLRGAQQAIESARPIIIAEANDVQGLAKWLSARGYRPFSYAPDRRELREVGWQALPTGNIVAVADLTLARQRLRHIAHSDGHTV